MQNVNLGDKFSDFQESFLRNLSSYMKTSPDRELKTPISYKKVCEEILIVLTQKAKFVFCEKLGENEPQR